MCVRWYEDAAWMVLPIFRVTFRSANLGLAVAACSAANVMSLSKLEISSFK